MHAAGVGFCLASLLTTTRDLTPVGAEVFEKETFPELVIASLLRSRFVRNRLVTGRVQPVLPDDSDDASLPGCCHAAVVLRRS